MTEPLFTIGHSTRSIEEFLDLLRDSGVTRVVDVRKLPGSRRYPQFGEDALAASLRAEGIRLERLPALTGRRPVSRTVPFETNTWWQNRSFHNYADHALSLDFRDALGELIGMAAGHRCAVMCSEAVWWRCHRRIIADHLLARDLTVQHIMGPGHVDPAQLSAGAVLGDDGAVSYPAGADDTA
ncbi:hypothetical protein KVA01_06460 [Kocuria varians]|uniref:DNA repair protein n=1 Tax=Kocuria varians TaxID=1272 RepID=A0A4Y4D028_KOCVA|nr:DUF488 domain-containing protein [Kocuria varians]GEC98491.1 hypothetical protein KVA01_06460 [Kocuria varians]